MTADLDIYRTASVLIREHGEEAALEAAQRADAMLERGDMEGRAYPAPSFAVQARTTVRSAESWPGICACGVTKSRLALKSSALKAAAAV